MNSENYIVIDGKKAELTEEALDTLRTFDRFLKLAKEQFGLTITQKETTGETFKTLFGTEVEPEHTNPFNRVKKDEKYFLLRGAYVSSEIETRDVFDNHNIDYVNYFNDKAFAKQVMLHQQLYRKLLKYAYDNNAEDCEREWDGKTLHYYIFFDSTEDYIFKVDGNIQMRSQNVYFSKRRVAEQAIEDVIKPFIKEHPEFVW